MTVWQRWPVWLALIGIGACARSGQRDAARELPPLALAATPASDGPGQVRGLWLWTRGDLPVFESSRRRLPELEAGVFIADFECPKGALALRRGLSPLTAGVSPRALVVRFSDSMQACFAQLDSDALAKSLDKRFTRLLDEVNDTGVHFRELQIDYDAPVSKLADYARLLGYLRAHSLRGVDLWITSIPVHLQQPGYGAALRGIVTGHIIQVFDTGLICSAEEAERLHAAVRAQPLPYRIGYGAFERAGAAPELSHRCWQSRTTLWRADPEFAGIWLFPAGIGDDAAVLP